MGKRQASDLFFGLGPKMTAEQQMYLSSIYSNRMTIVDAKAGTGKTTIAVAAAKTIFDTKGMPLLYVFNPVEEDRMGYRTGDQRAKESAYLLPLLDALNEIREDARRAIRNEDAPTAGDKLGTAWVEAKSHIFVRGSNIKERVVVIAEAQNWRKEDLKKMLTRLHDSCKVIVEGHIGQCDLRNEHGELDPSLSGFPRLKEHFDGKDYVQVCELTTSFRGQLATDADEL